MAEPDCRGQPAGPAEDDDQVPTEAPSTVALLAVVTVASLAGVWFLVAWLAMDSPLIDALGETFGAVMLGLLVISIFGAFRRPR